MDRQTGKPLASDAHLQQSITDILTTPLGTRVMRRDYGSRLFELIDAPIHSKLIFELSVATAQALTQWEPRLSLTRVQVESVSEGQITLMLSGQVQGKQWHSSTISLSL